MSRLLLSHFSRVWLCVDPIDGSPPGNPVPGILQARTLAWLAISFSNAWKWKVKVKSLSHARLLATPWTAAIQAPPSMGFSRQEYWSRLPLPSLKTSLKYFKNHLNPKVKNPLMSSHITCNKIQLLELAYLFLADLLIFSLYILSYWSHSSRTGLGSGP